MYRRQPLKQKRGKDNFRKTVRECLSRSVLTTERIRTFSRRARAYICAYYKLWTEKQQRAGQAVNTHHDDNSDPISIAKLVKKFKTHCCALDFDHSFCKATVIDLSKETEPQQQEQEQHQQRRPQQRTRRTPIAS